MGEGGDTWNRKSTSHEQWPERPVSLAAQWRYVCRVLGRHAPEERLHDPRRQLCLGDHILVRYTWELADLHGIVCSVGGDDSYGRRGQNQEQHWVVHWATSRLQCVPLSQFAKNGALFRVVYPNWACWCHVPASSTEKLYVEDERLLEAVNGDAVARQANNACQRGGFSSSWSQSQDLEFSIWAKSGGQLEWELHGRKTLSSSTLAPIGCQLRSDRSPSKLFAGDTATAVAPLPGATPSPTHKAAAGWLGEQSRDRPEASQNKQAAPTSHYPQFGQHTHYPQAAAGAGPMTHYPQVLQRGDAMQGGGSGMSAATQPFVPNYYPPTQQPAQMQPTLLKNWENIYQ